MKPKIEVKENLNRIAILIDDEPDIQDAFKILFSDLEIKLALKVFSNKDEYDKFLSTLSQPNSVKTIIYDLALNKNEVTSENFSISPSIDKQIKNNRIPIFIHSGNLSKYGNYRENGIVLKYDKSPTSVKDICELIQLMENSDFLNMFCFGGVIEEKIMEQLHQSFNTQFKNDEISALLKSIKEPDDLKQRTEEIFRRIAVRSLYRNLIDNYKIHVVEHYYIRDIGTKKFFTGDIFKSKTDNQYVVLVTPRCNVDNNNYTELLLCGTSSLTKSQIQYLSSPKKSEKFRTKGEENFVRSITDDDEKANVSERNRFLPPCPSKFDGCWVEFKNHFTLNEEDFLTQFEYHISLSDDLANEVIRKFTNYLMRMGIADTEHSEAHQYFLSINAEQE